MITKTSYEAGDIEVSKIGSPTYTNLQNIINTKSSGIISGGTISDSGFGQIDVSAGQGIIKITDDVMAETKSFDWGLTENIDLIDGQVNYIYINNATGTPVVAVTTTRSSITQYWQFTLGRVFRNGTALHIINSGTQITNHDRGTHERLVMRGIQWGEGVAVSFTNKQLSSTAGKLYLGNNKLTIGTTLITDNITQWYHNAGVWESALGTEVDNTYYDNGTNKTELGNAKYGVHWIYVCGCGGDLKLVYGRDSYSLSEAENASVPSSIPDCVDKLAILAAKVIILKGASSILSIASAYETNFPVSSPANHNDLGGIQGGAATEYYHITAANVTKLAGIDAGADVTSANAPQAHETSHKSGGSDEILLDEFGTPTDVATLNASTSAHGLLKKLDNNAANFMNGQGNWAAPGGGGSQTVNINLPAEAAYLPATNPAALTEVAGATVYGGYSTLNFDDTTDEHAIWEIPVPDYDGGNMTFTFFWFATAIIGTVAWTIESIGVTDGEEIIEAVVTDLADVSADTVTGTTLDLNVTTYTTYNPASVTADDLMKIEITRDVSRDSLVGDAKLKKILVEYTRS